MGHMGQLLHASTGLGCYIHPTPLRANAIDSAPHTLNFGWYMPILTTRVVRTEALQRKLLSQMFQAKFSNSQMKLYQFLASLLGQGFRFIAQSEPSLLSINRNYPKILSGQLKSKG
jgi:hypothetical protein